MPLVSTRCTGAPWKRRAAASAEEKAELWPRIVAAYDGYQRYQNSTARDIPVVIAEPLAR